MLISMHIDTLYLYVWYSTYKSRDNVITARHLEVVLFNANVGTLSLFPNHYNAWLWKWMKYLNFILYRSFRSTNTSQFTDHVQISRIHNKVPVLSVCRGGVGAWRCERAQCRQETESRLTKTPAPAVGLLAVTALPPTNTPHDLTNNNQI